MLGATCDSESFTRENNLAAKRTESVERAMSILTAFSNDAPKLTLTQLAAETGLHKSTVLRLTTSMSIYGFIQRDEKGYFSIGSSVWRLGLLFRKPYLSRELVTPVLQTLVEATGESASFYVRTGDERVCLYRVNSTSVVRVHAEEGIRLNLSTGASGRVLRHFAGEDTSQAHLMNRNGTTHSVGQTIPDISSIATPVFSADGDLLGALAVSGVRSRFGEQSREQAIPLLEDMARSLQV